MKTALVLAIILILIMTVCGCTNSSTTAGNSNNIVQELQSPAPESAKEQTTPPAADSNTSGIEEKKILVAYFSHTGNTRVIANQIHEDVGGDIVEIKTVDPYPADYDAVVEHAKRNLTRISGPC